MPLIEVTLAEGRTPVQLRTLISALTHAAAEAVDAPLDSIRVVIREVPTTHWGAGDVTIAERRGAPDPRTDPTPTPEGEPMSELQFFGHIIDNEEVESLDGARFDVWNPWTREVWAQAAGGQRRRCRPRRRERPQGLRRGAVAAAGARRASGADPPARRPHGGARRRPGDPRRDEHGQAVPAGQARRRPVGGELPVLRRPPARQRRRGLPDGLRAPHLQRVRPGRCRGRDLPVELPADDGHLEDRPGDRVGQHLHHQAERGHPGVGDAARPRSPSRPASRPACSTCSTGTARRPAPRSPRTTGSTG